MSTYVHRARVSRALHASLAVSIASFLLACTRDAAPTATSGVGPAVALSITTPALSLVVGDGASVSARAVDAGNRTVAASVTWSSADPTIATVREVDGYVVGVSPGRTIVTARAGALAATAIVSVRRPDPPVAVSISRTAVSLIPGSVERLVARAVDSTGRVANVSFEWVVGESRRRDSRKDGRHCHRYRSRLDHGHRHYGNTERDGDGLGDRLLRLVRLHPHVVERWGASRPTS